ncbi:hypothetical protein BTVI_09586 [Pitangus sulphuratus]|nr:hypothetical protein BTVI_09586 [Pitangus sulphuratus]
MPCMRSENNAGVKMVFPVRNKDYCCQMAEYLRKSQSWRTITELGYEVKNHYPLDYNYLPTLHHFYKLPISAERLPKVSPKPSLLWTEQPQHSQSDFIDVLQPPDPLHGPPLDPSQQVLIFLVLTTPELDATLQEEEFATKEDVNTNSLISSNYMTKKSGPQGKNKESKTPAVAGRILEGLIADSLPKIVDISATELMQLGPVVVVFYLSKFPWFYEKLDEGNKWDVHIDAVPQIGNAAAIEEEPLLVVYTVTLFSDLPLAQCFEAAGESPAKATRMMKRLEDLMYEERLRELLLFSLKKTWLRKKWPQVALGEV